MNRIDKISEYLMEKAPDLIIGKTKEYEKELYLLYGNIENQENIFSMRLKNLKKYIFTILILLSILLLAFSVNLLEDKESIVVDKNGAKYIERPTYDEGNINTRLILSGEVEGKTIKKPVSINVKPEGANDIEEKQENDVNIEESAISKLDSMIYQINKSDDDKGVYLPNKIEGIKDIKWEVENKNPYFLIFFMGVAILICIFFTRYDELNILKKRCNESIDIELPEFLNKVVLLMNAGLVLSVALDKIIKDYSSYEYIDKSYFYKQLVEINVRVKETNSPIVGEIKKFAERSKNREFMRVTSVISDNMHKGTELVNILQNESNFLWFQRKKRAEEKGRIAETKLTMPLALQLLVLIIITLAPAMLEM